MSSTPTETKASLLFVYGTLKRFEINYPFWMGPQATDEAGALFLGSAETLDMYPLFVNSMKYENCSPALLNLPGEGRRVKGELYEVSDEKMKTLDILEEVATGLYEARPIRVRVTKYRRHQQSGHNFKLVAAQEVEALVYFRAREFDEDWRVSRPLLSEFRAASSLIAEPKTYRSLPCHMACSDLETPPCRPKPMVLVILDGVGDVQCEVLQGRTPLQAACDEAPALSLITRNGVSGLMDPYAAGYACGSDTAHLSMLGYDPLIYYRGRGAFESLGAGMTMEADRDIAFKCNFSVTTQIPEDAAAGHLPIVSHRRCDREFTQEGPVLCAALDGTTVVSDVMGVPLEHGPHVIRVTYATEHRCGVVITGDFLSDHISGTDPLTDGLRLIDCSPVRGHEDDARAVYTSRVVMAASAALAAVLRVHPINEERVAVGKRPANIVLLRGASLRSFIPEFERRHGLKGFMVAPTCIIRGLGACCGLDIVESSGGTGDYHSNILGKAEAVVATFAAHESTSTPYHFGVLHVKGTDDAGHDGDPALKVTMLRRSAEAIEYLWRTLPVGSTIAVTGDHTTICSMEDHATEPVPISIATIPATRGSHNPSSSTDGDVPTVQRCWSGRVEGTLRFDEVDCGLNGSIGRMTGGSLVDCMKAVHYGTDL
ncbi:2,3-bisphosphoglycerate-independent phosphoglycerate mutase, putative [Bodo saltans]|uniref:2,3-bisphosphoglycerate-independent phosphoglycerate mutase, putative n=1 Tax=Bodo saltans TaxID=75058 RepID=A0A0S4J9H6_BODSA|nr:2,3-bisphosphoglycerate-independent phosphoglycerate mutase, putative [Bodo saltans]|eukprot:CUG87924.1 2,3-bisphosphoglycerate-independent phosphoglycerate mutase, putative [Bodo saltans]